jgi:hypothetical protein
MQASIWKHVRRLHNAINPNPPSLQPCQPWQLTFFKGIKAVSAAGKHTTEYAQKHRVNTHGMQHTNGQAHWWLTLALDDVCNMEIWLKATGEAPDVPPPRNRRFRVLSSHPGERIL